MCDTTWTRELIQLHVVGRRLMEARWSTGGRGANGRDSDLVTGCNMISTGRADVLESDAVRVCMLAGPCRWWSLDPAVDRGPITSDDADVLEYLVQHTEVGRRWSMVAQRMPTVRYATH